MATQYLTRAKLEALLGVKTITTAEQQMQANVQAVIDACSAEADGYVSKQVPLPLTATATEQVSPIVADLVLARLYANSQNELIQKRGDAAVKRLRDIADGLFVLHQDAPADDPNTPEDESALGSASCGSAARVLTGWSW